MQRSRAGENAVTPRTREGEADECAAMNGKEGETRTHASDLKKPASGNDEGPGKAGGRGGERSKKTCLRERRRGPRQRSGADPAYVHEPEDSPRGFSSLTFFHSPSREYTLAGPRTRRDS